MVTAYKMELRQCLKAKKKRGLNKGNKRKRVLADENGGECKRWSELPELILNAIIMRLACTESFMAFRSVCQTWRSASEAAAAEFNTLYGPPVFLALHNSYHSKKAGIYDSANVFYCVQDGQLYQTQPIPAGVFEGLTYIGLSNGHLIALDSATKNIPTVLNILSGIRVDFPPIQFNTEDDSRKIPRYLHFALLTAPPAEPNCALILIYQGLGDTSFPTRILYCRLGDTKWVMKPSCTLSDAIVFRGQLYLYRDFLHIYNLPSFELVRYVPPHVPSQSHSMMMESSEGELLKVHYEGGGPDKLTVYKLMLNEKSAVWEKYEWPTDRSLFLSWQRSDWYASLPSWASISAYSSGKAAAERVIIINPCSIFYSKAYSFCTNSLLAAANCTGGVRYLNLLPRPSLFFTGAPGERPLFILC